MGVKCHCVACAHVPKEGLKQMILVGRPFPRNAQLVHACFVKFAVDLSLDIRTNTPTPERHKQQTIPIAARHPMGGLRVKAAQCLTHQVTGRLELKHYMGTPAVSHVLLFYCLLGRIVPFSIKPGEYFRSELPHNTIIPSAGFPSLHVLPVGSVEERKVPVNVFGTASR